jgi:hypothetical protein
MNFFIPDVDYPFKIIHLEFSNVFGISGEAICTIDNSIKLKKYYKKYFKGNGEIAPKNKYSENIFLEPKGILYRFFINEINMNFEQNLIEISFLSDYYDPFFEDIVLKRKRKLNSLISF